MRNVLGSAMVVTMALCLYSAVLLFGAVTIDLLAIPFALAAVVASLWGVKLMTARVVSWKQSPIHWPVLGFLLYTIIRYFTSPLEHASRVELLQVCLYAAVYFACACNLYHSRERAWLIGALMGLAFLQSGYGIWQVITQSNAVLFSVRPEVYTGRASGTFICPNHMAGFLVMILGLLAGRAAYFHGKKGAMEKGMVRKVLIIYVALMGTAGILMTFSRAGWISAMVVMIALMAWGDWRLRAGWPRIAVVGLLLLAFAGAAIMVPRVLEKANRNLVTDQSAGGRTLMWNATLHIIKESPLIGTGPGTWQWAHQEHRLPRMQGHPEYAHSDVLQVFSDYGVVGALFVVAFFACFFWQVALMARRKTRSEQRSFAIGSALAVIGILVHSMVDFNLHIPANALLMVTLIGFTAGMDDHGDRFTRNAMPKKWRYLLGTGLLVASVAGCWLVGRMAFSALELQRGYYAKAILQWDTAMDHGFQASALDPGNPEPYKMMADIYRLQAEWRLDPDKAEERRELATVAVELFQQALILNPFSTDAWIRLARSYQVLDDYDKALEVMDEVLKIDPLNTQVHMRLALIYQRLGEEELAAEAFAKAEELNPSGDDVSRVNLQEILPRRSEDD